MIFVRCDLCRQEHFFDDMDLSEVQPLTLKALCEYIGWSLEKKGSAYYTICSMTNCKTTFRKHLS